MKFEDVRLLRDNQQIAGKQRIDPLETCSAMVSIGGVIPE
jgi:hypothetical protein